MRPIAEQPGIMYSHSTRIILIIFIHQQNVVENINFMCDIMANTKSFFV